MTSLFDHGTIDALATIYASIEFSKKTWVVAIAVPDRDKASIHRIGGGDVDTLISRVSKVAGKACRVVVCYEAGYDGFWLARLLPRHGITCHVLDPASLQVNRRARRVKTDRIDALALLRAVIAINRGERHVCAVVRVPSVAEEDARRSHRERQRLVRERTGHVNRIKGLLFAQGIRGVDPKLRRTRIDPDLAEVYWRLMKTKGHHHKQALCAVANRDGCSPSCSNNRRTARDRTSTGNLFAVFFAMAPSSQDTEPPAIPGRLNLSISFSHRVLSSTDHSEINMARNCAVDTQVDTSGVGRKRAHQE